MDLTRELWKVTKTALFPLAFMVLPGGEETNLNPLQTSFEQGRLLLGEWG